MHSRSGYEMVVRPKGRTPADEYLHKGKCWIEGRENSTYIIQLTNNTASRVSVVVSVDGLCVLDGKPASYDSHGFIVDPYTSVEIPGWVVDQKTAAAFLFGKKEPSYASYKNADQHTGVIGAAWFKEKTPETILRARSSYIASSASRVSVNCNIVNDIYQDQSLGTGWGNDVEINLHEVKFEKSNSSPDSVMVIYYDSADNLKKMGIKLKPRVSNVPDAFPGSSEKKFCERPTPSWVVKNR